MTMEIFNHESAEVYGCGWIVTIFKKLTQHLAEAILAVGEEVCASNGIGFTIA